MPAIFPDPDRSERRTHFAPRIGDAGYLAARTAAIARDRELAGAGLTPVDLLGRGAPLEFILAFEDVDEGDFRGHGDRQQQQVKRRLDRIGGPRWCEDGAKEHQRGKKAHEPAPLPHDERRRLLVAPALGGWPHSRADRRSQTNWAAWGRWSD